MPAKQTNKTSQLIQMHYRSAIISIISKNQHHVLFNFIELKILILIETDKILI